MASRIPRRTFAAPFVVTLAAGCFVEKAPPPAQPPPSQPPPPTVVSNPPRPQPDPDPKPNPNWPQNPPSPTDQSPPPKQRSEWTVTMTGGKCTAAIKVDCPPVAMCNPPGPRPTDCLPYMANMTEGVSLTVVQYPGAADCIIPPGPMHCPPKAACNPPPPRHVACPK
jgi:hypothetical protein